MDAEKAVSNSIWGNDEKSAYGTVDFDSSVLRNGSSSEAVRISYTVSCILVGSCARLINFPDMTDQLFLTPLATFYLFAGR